MKHIKLINILKEIVFDDFEIFCDMVFLQILLARGGIGILHKSTAPTIKKLKDLGI